MRPEGLYPLYTGMYIQETLDRLNVLDASGQSVGDQVHLTDIELVLGNWQSSREIR